MDKEDGYYLLGVALIMFILGILVIAFLKYKEQDFDSELEQQIQVEETEEIIEITSEKSTLTEAEEIDKVSVDSNITKESKKTTEEKIIEDANEQVECGNGLYIPEIGEPEFEVTPDPIIATAYSEEYLGEFELTAYTWTGNPCADGDYPRASHTIACNDSRLWHQWVTIEGYGTYYCHDTGGMSSNVIDIYMDSYDSCIQFGRRSAKVYIVH